MAINVWNLKFGHWFFITATRSATITACRPVISLRHAKKLQATLLNCLKTSQESAKHGSGYAPTMRIPCSCCLLLEDNTRLAQAGPTMASEVGSKALKSKGPHVLHVLHVPLCLSDELRSLYSSGLGSAARLLAS